MYYDITRTSKLLKSPQKPRQHMVPMQLGLHFRAFKIEDFKGCKKTRSTARPITSCVETAILTSSAGGLMSIFHSSSRVSAQKGNLSSRGRVRAQGEGTC